MRIEHDNCEKCLTLHLAHGKSEIIVGYGDDGGYLES